MNETLNSNTSSCLDAFDAPVREWFLSTFDAPTPIQQKAWAAAAKGSNALIIAPTGSGKTLAAFLYSIDMLYAQKEAAAKAGEAWKRGVRILYVSPLKALGADVERNLQIPLGGISANRQQSGKPQITIDVDMRSGDTTPQARRRIQSKPPDILITTPESLYLMLTSKARSILESVECVIVDEVHAMANTKRGSHLSLSLERLDDLVGHPIRRIGLSATVRPHEVVAKFLGGSHPVEVVADEAKPSLDLSISVPVSDLTAIPAYGGMDAPSVSASKSKASPKKRSSKDAWKSDRSMAAYMRESATSKDLSSDGASKTGKTSHVKLTPDSRLGASSIWPYIESRVLDMVLSHESTIVFVNSRGLCERLTARLNEMYSKRIGATDPIFGADLPSFASEGGVLRSSMGSSTQMVDAAEAEIARAHHGSVAKDLRHSIESDLKSGSLRCVVATSSLELGIDMGDVDLVIQIAPPQSVSSGLQRAGRANHHVGGKSNVIIYPKVRTEIVEAAVMANAMLEGAIERTALVENALDVLAQQTVAAVAMAPKGLSADDWFSSVTRSANYATLSRSAFDSVVRMLAGRMSDDPAEAKPRIAFDEVTGVMKPLDRTQRLAVASAGTIPDRGMYPVMLSQAASTGFKGRKRVGELDEEMVHESRIGDIIILGTSTWRITEITNDRVLVQPAPGRSARLPFWHGEGVGHDMEFGVRKGSFLRSLDAAVISSSSSDSASTQEEAGGLEGASNQGSTASVPVGAGRLKLANAMSSKLNQLGLDANAIENLCSLIAEQRACTRKIPSDKTIVLERCPDEAGGFYLILHSPYGRRIHEPWALAITERIASKYKFDPHAAASDDSILLRVPFDEGMKIGAEDFIFDPEEIEDVMRSSLTSTTLFAARFRECAARALLMSPRTPGKRVPLWQQRLRGAQLLEDALRVEGFPIVAEAARECLQDVYDVASLKVLMGSLNSRQVELYATETSSLSPFAAPLVFGYVADHIYDGDRPAADRNAALLSVDSTLLGELIGSSDIASLLDEEVIAQMTMELQHTSPDWRRSGADGLEDLLRELGPMSADDLRMRMNPGAGHERFDDTDEVIAKPELKKLLGALEAEHRIFSTKVGRKSVWASVGDASRLKDAYGCELPEWASAFVAGHDKAAATQDRLIDGLVARFARTHALFTVGEAAEHLGLGEALVKDAIQALVKAGRIRKVGNATDGSELMADSSVLKRLRARSLAKARNAIELVNVEAYSSYLIQLQNILTFQQATAEYDFERAIDDLGSVIAQYEGVFLPVKMWEQVIFPARVPGYKPQMLDSLLESGDVIWIGSSEGTGGSKSAAFFPSDSPFAPQAFDAIFDSLEDDMTDDHAEKYPDESSDLEIHRAISQELALNPKISFTALCEGVALRTSKEDADVPAGSKIAQGLVDLLWSGRACVDSFQIARDASFDPTRLDKGSASNGSEAQRRVSSRRRSSRYLSPASAAKREARASVISKMATASSLAGRWYVPMSTETNATTHAIEATESLFERFGLITGSIAYQSGIKGGLTTIYPVLRNMEDSGMALRGVFVEGLGGAQFADRYTIDELREHQKDANNDEIYVMRADDPANIYGAIIGWPKSRSDAKLQRKSDAVVCIANGKLIIYASPNLKNITTFTDDEALIERAIGALAQTVIAERRAAGSALSKRKFIVETIDGRSALDADNAEMLQRCGFIRDPKGYRLYISAF